MDRGVLARALYTNTPEAKTELYFRKGDIVTVIEFDYENQMGWWLCSLRGQRGICPGNYFELLEDKYSLPHSPISTNSNNIRGGSSTTTIPSACTGTRDGIGESESAVLVGDPLEMYYDVPRGAYNHRQHQHQHHDQTSPSPSQSLSKVNPLEFYDVPRTHIPVCTHTPNSTDSLSRAKNRQSELSLLSTGSSAHLSSSASSSASSSSASSSARSSANCDLSSIHDVSSRQHEHDSFFQVNTTSCNGGGGTLREREMSTFDGSSGSGSGSGSSSGNGNGSSRININNTVEESIRSQNKSQSQSQSQSQGNIHHIIQSTSTNHHPTHPHPRHHNNSSHYPQTQSNRSSIQSETMMSVAPLQELYDVPRSAPTSRAQSAMSMSSSSGLGLSIANSESKDSLDYDVPRNTTSTNCGSSSSASNGHAYVNHLETKYDNPSVSNSCRSSCCSINSYSKTNGGRNNDETNTLGHEQQQQQQLLLSESTTSCPRPGATSSMSDKGRVKPSYEIGNGRTSTNASTCGDVDDTYDVPRSSVPAVVVRRHPPHYPSSSINSSLASFSMSKESLRSNRSNRRYNSNNSNSNSNSNSNGSQMGSSFGLDMRRRGIIQNGQSTDTLPTMGDRFNSNQHLSQNSSDDMLSFDDQDDQFDASSLSLNSFGNKTVTARSSFCSVRSTGSFDGAGQERTMSEDVKFLPLNPRAAVTVCEKLRQEVITSVNSIVVFVRPKWRTKENLNEIMPDLRFSCIRFNLAIKDMTDFCSRCLSNAKKFTIDALATKLQRLLSPLIHGSQIIQRDVDELEAYFWSVDRLSQSSHNSKNVTPDCLEQLILCAKSLQHDATEIANFLALNSSALFREPERLNPPQIQSNPVVTETSNNTSEGPTEDYDYVSLMPMDQVDGTENRREEERGACSIDVPPPPTTTPYLVSSDQQLLEFYSSQIAATAPLLSQSISTFISSIQRNDPPKSFNGHLKYVILLAYKMLFVGDTVHRNILNVEIKEEVENKANELHKSVVSLHEASRVASRDFPRIPPMQNIVDRVWETTAAATQLKKVMINAACF